MELFYKISKTLLYLSLVGFILPFLLALVGFGGEVFMQVGWVYSFLAMPFVLIFALIVLIVKGVLNKKNKVDQNR